MMKDLNAKASAQYQADLKRVEGIFDTTKDSGEPKKKYIHKIAEKILYFADLEKENLKNKNIEELKEINEKVYFEIKPENYDTSYANPEYSVQQLGKDLGAAYSNFYIAFRSFYSYALEHSIYNMQKWNAVFIDLFDNSNAEDETIPGLLTKVGRDVNVMDTELNFVKRFGEESIGYRDIVLNCDHRDLRYLYQYDKYISGDQIKTAEFLQNYPEDKIKQFSLEMVKAYTRGFELARKDLSTRKIVKVIYNVGQERIIKQLTQDFTAKGFKVLLTEAASTNPNKQYGYDHRFDGALLYDEEFAAKTDEVMQEAVENCSVSLNKYSGTFYFDKFGEKPFAPKAKSACLKLNPEQQKLMQRMNINHRQLLDKYMSRSVTSFCIVAFPIPEIGKQFEEIFEDTLSVNMIDTLHHEDIQQHIVDVADKADIVHVKGKNGNLTDIKVKMQKLEDPNKHTNFVNCGADVNVPVGEIFTSPKLEGTNGVLHLKETFLKGLKFVDIKLTFKDGFVDKFSCANFDSEEENQKFILENLLFPHKTLPLGEFAIGTNTQAYVMAKKYDILDILPVLIVEKMGPHFAIGDTCFSWEEDFAVYNPIDGKEITARENSKSALRKTDMHQAYTNCHTDITLPYEDLDFITAISAKGEKFDIIRDGRFVVKGSEELNEPLDEWENQ
jgi:leucyl aminopeptidase (aminopeptidase T)